MAVVSPPDVMERLIVPAARSSYPTLETSYHHGGYEVDHARRLVQTGKHYYDSKAEIPEGMRMSTAGEELALQLKYETAAQLLRRIDEQEILGRPPSEIASILRDYAVTESEREAVSYVFGMESDAMQRTFEQGGVLIPDPRNATIFDDLFGRKNDGWYAWQCTETGLRVPTGREAGKYETDAQGRKYWARIVLDGDKEVGEVLAPEGGGRLVAEWDDVFGVPRVTIENRGFPHKPYTTHFWFNATPNIDDTSGHYDVAVERWSRWHRVVEEGCLDVGARYRRMDASSDGGFRLVRGSRPLIEVVHL